MHECSADSRGARLSFFVHVIQSLAAGPSVAHCNQNLWNKADTKAKSTNFDAGSPLLKESNR
jgi:hypothetical protein